MRTETYAFLVVITLTTFIGGLTYAALNPPEDGAYVTTYELPDYGTCSVLHTPDDETPFFLGCTQRPDPDCYDPAADDLDRTTYEPCQ